MNNHAMEAAGLMRGIRGSYRGFNDGRKINIENYSLNNSMKNTQDRNDINNKLMKLVSTPNYYNFDSFNLSYVDMDLTFTLPETIENIEKLKLDHIILPVIAGFEYYDIYLSIQEIKYGYKYNNEYYQFNLIPKTPNAYIPVDKVIMKPVNKTCILERNVDMLTVVTFKIRDNYFKEIPFPKSVIKAVTIPATNPIQISYPDHGLVNGDTIFIKNTVLCGTYTVTVLDLNTFTIPYDGTLITTALHPVIQIPKFRILIRINLGQFNGY